MLARELGPDAYAEARLMQRKAKSNDEREYWRDVAMAVIRIAKKGVGLDTVTRMANCTRRVGSMSQRADLPRLCMQREWRPAQLRTSVRLPRFAPMVAAQRQDSEHKDEPGLQGAGTLARYSFAALPPTDPIGAFLGANERQRALRDHQFFVGGDDPDRYAAIRGGNARPAGHVRRLVQLHAEPRHLVA